MNTERPENDTWEREMSSEFERRVRDLHEAPLTLDQIRGRAGSIKRRRAGMVVAGVLATAALITPVALIAGGSDDSLQPPVATHTPTASDTANVQPPANQGDQVPYLSGRKLHRADGSTLVLPQAYEGATDLGDRVVAWANNPDELNEITVDVLYVQDSRADFSDSYAAALPPLTSQGGSYVVFVSTDGALQTVWGDGERVLAEGLPRYATTPVAAVGEDCATECRVYVTLEKEQRSVAIDQDGTQTPVAPGKSRVSAASANGEVVAVIRFVDDFTACSEVLDTRTGAVVVPETCDYRFDDISPDGEHLLAVDPQTDGFGPAQVTVLDRDLNKVATVDTTRSQGIGGYRFLDDQTVVASIYDFGSVTWKLVTLDLAEGGPVQTVLGPLPGSDLDPPFLLAD
ncbi:hypothetical protein [Nocardioides sp. GXZ039]|uniref:hypothetical protein n=1 Tax=Nocardioides sp. GXZ039 TaxID=3136018 RepID=UPI0030F3AB5E